MTYFLTAHLDSVSWKNTRTLLDVSKSLVDEIARNFQGKEFKVSQRRGGDFARRLVERGIKAFLRSQLQE